MTCSGRTQKPQPLKSGMKVTLRDNVAVTQVHEDCSQLTLRIRQRFHARARLFVSTSLYFCTNTRRYTKQDVHESASRWSRIVKCTYGQHFDNSNGHQTANVHRDHSSAGKTAEVWGASFANQKMRSAEWVRVWLCAWLQCSGNTALEETPETRGTFYPEYPLICTHNYGALNGQRRHTKSYCTCFVRHSSISLHCEAKCVQPIKGVIATMVKMVLKWWCCHEYLPKGTIPPCGSLSRLRRCTGHLIWPLSLCRHIRNVASTNCKQKPPLKASFQLHCVAVQDNDPGHSGSSTRIPESNGPLVERSLWDECDLLRECIHALCRYLYHCMGYQYTSISVVGFHSIQVPFAPAVCTCSPIDAWRAPLHTTNVSNSHIEITFVNITHFTPGGSRCMYCLTNNSSCGGFPREYCTSDGRFTKFWRSSFTLHAQSDSNETSISSWKRGTAVCVGDAGRSTSQPEASHWAEVLSKSHHDPEPV